MKKLIFFLVTLTLVFSLGACKSASSDTSDYALKSDLELLEEEIQALQERIDKLVVVTGLNGTVSIYENQRAIEELNLSLIVLSTELTDLSDTKKDKFDKNKTAPDYLIDDLGSYVSFEDLSTMLKYKYFDSTVDSLIGVGTDVYNMGSQAKIRFIFKDDLDTKDIVVRMVMLIEELRNYDFYIMSSNEILLEVYMVDSDGEIHMYSISIPLTVMLNDFFTIDLETIYYDWFEMEYDGEDFVLDEAKLLYDDYLTNLTYDGYVLNYIE